MLLNLVKQKHTVVIFFRSIVISVFLCLSQVSSNAKTHIIAKGETIGIIAKKYKLTISELAGYNGIRNPNRVKVGQRINIPENSISINYTVKLGDTLSSIAKKHQTTPDNIAKTNKISNPRKLKPGQKLKIIKGSSPKSTKPKVSNISEDSLSKINRPRVRRGRWKHIVVHHSGDNTNSIQGMEHYHRRVRRMENGLAYHFVIGNGVNTVDGKIYTGSRWSRQIRGGHVASTALNDIAIGICLVGNFDKRTPTAKQRSSLKALVYRLRQRTGIPLREVRTHRNINPKPTACPGRLLNLKGILN